jgi:leader peptidase (prepilin peptidase)/N-methyltransferase
MLGAIFGYLILWIINKLFYALKKQQGIGEGDFDLLAMIGSFTGISGVWISLLFASFSASIIGLILIGLKKISKNTMVPFGPFIAFGALFYIFSIYSKYNIIKLLINS